MYSFNLGGIRVLHMGDLGHPVNEEYLAGLAGNVDLLLALAGGHPTIALDDLEAAIERIAPKIVIPMHYYHARGVLSILPVTELTGRFPEEAVTWTGTGELTITPGRLPETTHVYVMEQTR